MSDAKRAFRIGFLQKCAEAGLSADEACDLAGQIKRAFAGEQLIGKGLDLAGTAMSTAGPWGALLALGGPPIVGSYAGKAFSNLTDLDEEDIKALKRQEIIDFYRNQTRLLQEKKKRGVPQTAR